MRVCEGCLRLKIKLGKDTLNPNHAVRVSADLLVICHGDMTDQTQRVCRINNSGEVLNCCSVPGTPWPAHLTLVDAQQVYVVFRNLEQVSRTHFTRISGLLSANNLFR